MPADYRMASAEQEGLTPPTNTEILQSSGQYPAVTEKGAEKASVQSTGTPWIGSLDLNVCQRPWAAVLLLIGSDLFALTLAGLVSIACRHMLATLNSPLLW